MKAAFNSKNKYFTWLLLTLSILILTQAVVIAQVTESASQKNNELKEIKEAIHNVFGWAVKKDFNLFFQTIADDSNFISVTPYDRVKFGFNEVKKDSAFWAVRTLKRSGMKFVI